MTPVSGRIEARAMGTRRVVAVAAAFVIALAACSGGANDARPASTTASSSPSTAPASTTADSTTTSAADSASDDSPEAQLAKVMDERLNDDGTADAKLALDMFASVYGGAEELAATVLPGFSDGTAALRAVYAHWDEYSAAQQATITKQSDIPVVSETMLEPSGAVTPGTPPASSGFAPHPADLTAILQQAKGALTAAWGAPAPWISIQMADQDLPPDGPDVNPPIADAWPTTDGHQWAGTRDQYRVCRVRIFPIYSTYGPVDLLETMAHEMFHCYQFTVRDESDPAPDWLMEGQAEWVGATIGRGGSVAEGWWSVWLHGPQSLFRRTYDAIGFFAALANHGIDPWSVFRGMLLAPVDPLAEFHAATPGHDVGVLLDVIMDRSNRGAVGAPYLAVGPGVPGPDTVAADEIPSGYVARFPPTELKPFDGDSALVQVDDAVVDITVSGNNPWAFGGAGVALRQPGAATVRACVRGGCGCPNGASLNLPTASSNGLVAIVVANPTMQTETHELRVTGVPLASVCSAAPATTAAAPPTSLGCLVGTWKLTSQTLDLSLYQIFDANNMTVTGGTGGRFLDIAPSGVYVMSDDGTDPTVVVNNSAGTEMTTRVTTSGRVDGTVTMTDPQHALFTSTTADIAIDVRVVIPGASPIVSSQHSTDPAFFGNGEATVTCDANSLTTAFPKATFTYAHG